MKIIVTGHGQFASGLKSTIQLLAGSIPSVFYIDFLEDMSDKDLKIIFKNSLSESQEGAVFFCDLVGGTPYKQAALLSYECTNVSVIAGGNIGALLEVALKENLAEWQDAKELSELLIGASHNGIRKFGDFTPIEKIEEDGI